MKQITVNVADLVVGKRQRPVSKDKVNELAKSIHTIGMINPIIVKKDGVTIVAGAHRLEALKLLEQDSVRVNVIGNDADAKLIEVDENLKRSELKPAEKKEHIKTRIAEIISKMQLDIYEEVVQESVDNGNLSKQDKPLVIDILKGAKTLEDTDKNKVKEAVSKARNQLEKLAIQVVEGELNVTQRYIRDVLRKKAKPVTKDVIKSVTSKTVAMDFKKNTKTRINSVVEKLIQINDVDQCESKIAELNAILDKFEESVTN
ncbi:ParB/RepB/Spo0J family partition protein [Vibrio splendidus]